MKIKELLDNSWDIGLASGVLQGIELTPTLLPNQKEAIADARKALDRVAKRNQAALEGQSAQLSEAPNIPSSATPQAGLEPRKRNGGEQ